MRATTALTLGIALALMPAIVDAQTGDPESRHVVFAEGGYARTVHAEGLLGDGGSASGGYGFRITPGKTIQGIVSYASYYHAGISSIFDGKVLFIGGEIAFQSNRPRFRPFVTVGPGVFRFRDTWVKQREISPNRWIIDPPITRDFTFKGMTASGGIDVVINEHASIRAGARVHTVLDRISPDGAVPFMVFRPTVGAAFRW